MYKLRKKGLSTYHNALFDEQLTVSVCHISEHLCSMKAYENRRVYVNLCVR
ncbi:MAG: hypothetical protein H6Q59_2998 [Firmicutes bacterium]|nr:hypothetical protein [Bacillota bacterium]